MIHQIFLIARDWSERSKWLNIPQLKLGDTREYHLSDIPQFVNFKPHLFSGQIGEIVYKALYGDEKFSRGKHSANWVYISLWSAAFMVPLRGIMLHGAV